MLRAAFSRAVPRRVGSALKKAVEPRRCPGVSRRGFFFAFTSEARNCFAQWLYGATCGGLSSATDPKAPLIAATSDEIFVLSDCISPA